MRPSWDETWMRVAFTIADRSNCSNRKVGAVIVTAENRLVSMGYNGPPAGYVTSGACESFCPRGGSADRGNSYANCVSVHAEANALLFADRRQFSGGTIYVTNPCCWDCSKLVANSGLNRVVVNYSRIDEHADVESPAAFMKKCGLDVEMRSIL